MKLMTCNSSVPINLTFAAHVWVTAPAFRCPLGTGSDTCPHLTVRGWGSLPRPGTSPTSSGDSNSRTRKISEAAAFTIIDCFSNSPTRKISAGADIIFQIISDRSKSNGLNIVFDHWFIVLTKVSCGCWCCLRRHRPGPGTGINVVVRTGFTAGSVITTTWPRGSGSVTPQVIDPCQEDRDADINVDHVSICIGDDGLIVTDHSFIRPMPTIHAALLYTGQVIPPPNTQAQAKTYLLI